MDTPERRVGYLHTLQSDTLAAVHLYQLWPEPESLSESSLLHVRLLVVHLPGESLPLALAALPCGECLHGVAVNGSLACYGHIVQVVAVYHGRVVVDESPLPACLHYGVVGRVGRELQRGAFHELYGDIAGQCDRSFYEVCAGRHDDSDAPLLGGLGYRLGECFAAVALAVAPRSAACYVYRVFRDGRPSDIVEDAVAQSLPLHAY